MVPYAGKEPNPGEYSLRCKRAYQRFMRGMSTMEIAKKMNVSEATAMRYVTNGRCMVRGLASPYRHRRR